MLVAKLIHTQRCPHSHPQMYGSGRGDGTAPGVAVGTTWGCAGVWVWVRMHRGSPPSKTTRPSVSEPGLSGKCRRETWGGLRFSKQRIVPFGGGASKSCRGRRKWSTLRGDVFYPNHYSFFFAQIHVCLVNAWSDGPDRPKALLPVLVKKTPPGGDYFSPPPPPWVWGAESNCGKLREIAIP